MACDGMPSALSGDLLRGAGEIAAFLFGSDGKSERHRVYDLCQRSGFPTFKLGGLVCARRTTILGWIEMQEQGKNRQSKA